MPKNLNIKPALIGLIILFAFSLVMANGEKQKQGEKVSSYMRLLPASEIMAKILGNFPEMVPDDFKADIFDKQDTNSIKDLFQFSEIEGMSILNKFFPNFRFYKGLEGGLPPYPYLMAVSGKKRYRMPSYFNQLLLDNSLEVNDKNIIELAKTFVILAMGSKPITDLRRSSQNQELLSFPQITFLEGKMINKRIKDEGPYHAMVKIKINDKIEEWYFYLSPVEKGQFQGVSILELPSERFHHRYFPLLVPKEKPKEGGWDFPPRIQIDTLFGGVYIERQGDTLHHYLIVSGNGSSISGSVRIFLKGFPPESANVYVRAKSAEPSYARSFFFQRAEINADSCDTIIWFPSDSLTGITMVSAGYADTSAPVPEATYKIATAEYELTLEKVITGSFSGDTTYKIYFCHQFFVNHPLHPEHAPTFANYVKNAAIESWQKQVNKLYFSKLLIRDYVIFKSLLTD